MKIWQPYEENFSSEREFFSAQNIGFFSKTGLVTKAKAEKVKYVDDGSVAVSIDLKKCLIDDPQPRPRPLAYHERHQQILPSEKMYSNTS